VTQPGEDRTVEQPAVEAPTVSTAPPPSLVHRWWSSIPSHLGPARTSTVVLAVLFLAIGALYLTVRPEQQPAATVTPAAGTQQATTAPSRTAAPRTPTTTAPTTSAAPGSTTDRSPSTTAAPTTSAPTGTTTEPSTSSSAPSSVPTTEPVPTTAPLPTTGSAPTS
jgi:hypothetical protein